MVESVYYTRFEAGFEAVPTENYVYYITNVMHVGEAFILPPKERD